LGNLSERFLRWVAKSFESIGACRMFSAYFFNMVSRPYLT
jgi:hypothetical protein